MSAGNPTVELSGTQKAVRWYPPAYDIRVEDVPIPRVEHPDDAIVKIKLAGLCGSDLHIYRGHEDVDSPLTCGHELIGEVVALGTSFHPDAATQGRPELYATLKVGDKVVSPFTISCGECHFCRIGFTCRCIHSCLLGIPSLPGGQAQYARIPKAGGTLFSLSALPPASTGPLADASLLLLADILPTGVFAALQALQHPKVAPLLEGRAYPAGGGFVPKAIGERGAGVPGAALAMTSADRVLTVGVVGLGPVGVCATVSLLDILAGLGESHGLQYQVVAIDPLAARREKMAAVYAAIDASGKGSGKFAVADIEEGKALAHEWTDGAGCNAVLEVVGNNSALTLAYALVRPFGAISSVGVHQEPLLPFRGRDVYDKNVSFDFGRCPVRALFPVALDILLRRQDVFGGVGGAASLVDKVVGFSEAKEVYEEFDKGRCGKVLFDPWM